MTHKTKRGIQFDANLYLLNGMTERKKIEI